jgi:uncharacterized membrane protein
MEHKPYPRLWELDLIRGLAIVMMIIYHFLYDINYFGVLPLDVQSGFWRFFALATATIFILLVGVSLTLSTSEFRMRSPKGSLFLKLFTRGLKIFVLGEIITLATYVLIGKGYIIFGVLHLIGVSIVLSYPLLRFRVFNLVAGSVAILMGIYLQGLTYSSASLVWLGIVPENFYSLDYFPIFPWFGIVMIGIFVGNNLYRNGKRGFYLPDLSGSIAARSISAMGRNSLLIYLIHQPTIVAALFLAGMIPSIIPAR